MKLFPYVPSCVLLYDHSFIQLVKKRIEKQDKKSDGKNTFESGWVKLRTFESILPSISQFLF